MPTISVVLPNDGENADAADYNVPVLAILALLNGGLDTANLADGGIATADLADGAVTDVKLGSAAVAGWKALSAAPNSVTPLGNRSYQVVFNSLDLTTTLSPGTRLRFTRTTAAPTQCTSLNGTTQFYSKTSPAGMTFTNNFVVSAWIKLSAYQNGVIASRYNGTSGWVLKTNASGQLSMEGYNAGAANFKILTSTQTVPVNRWVHVAGQLDMSAATNSPTVNYFMIDGVDVPAIQTSGGTNPTALIQAGNLEVGSVNSGTLPFAGKLAQVAVYSAKVTQATILASLDHTLAGTETNLISAYSFNNSVSDLNANANNLSASGSAVATNADSPFGAQADGTVSSTLEYGIVMKASFSTNTTVTVQVPEGCALPSSGGINAASYATVKEPFGFPSARGKWWVLSRYTARNSKTSPGSGSSYNMGEQLNIPLGDWVVSYRAVSYQITGTSGFHSPRVDLNPVTATTTATSELSSVPVYINTATEAGGTAAARAQLSLAAATVYFLNVQASFSGTTNSIVWLHDFAAGIIWAEPACL